MVKGDPGYQQLAAAYMGRHVKTLTKQLKRSRRNDDSEAVHRVRVASRRLRAAMRMFGECFGPKTLTRWRKQVRRLGRRLGAARDLDVQVDFLREVLAELQDGPYVAGVARVRLRLRQEREALQPRVVKAMKRFGACGVIEQMQRELQAMSAAADGQAPAGEFVYGRARRRILRGLEKLHAYESCLARPGDQASHHAMRVAAKRLRYTMEICGDLYDEKMGGALQSVKNLQSLLGQIHDCDVWGQMLPAFLEKERRRTVAYFGEEAPAEEIRRGVEYLLADRLQRRQQLFAALCDYWRDLSYRSLWRRLCEVLLAYPGVSAAPAAPRAAEASQVQEAAR